MEPFRGIFPAMQTPLDESGDLDIASMERQTAFCIETGAHGLVYPVMGGELRFLSESERRRMVEVVVGTAAGQIPVVAGVAAPSAPIAAAYARHAAVVGADAVIALPPYIAQGSPKEIKAYYQAISDAGEIPVFIQHSWPGMSPALLARMLREIEHVSYVKEETAPSGHNISAVLDAVGDECLGVFGGAHGRWMIPEMRRGAHGFVPAAQTNEVYVAIWDAFQAGDEAKAREIFSHIAPLVDLLSLVGLRACKEILVRRGVFRTATLRIPGTPELDEIDRHELDLIMRDLEPMFCA